MSATEARPGSSRTRVTRHDHDRHLVATASASASAPSTPTAARRSRSPRGEIHALVGENGAGKSTLMRILAGMYAPDAGTRRGRRPRRHRLDARVEAIAAGVGMVHQHFMLVPTLTVAENVVLGRELATRRAARPRRAPSAEVAALGERTGLVVAPDAAACPTCRWARRSASRSSRCCTAARRILILDEPTAVLSPPEVQRAVARAAQAARSDGGTIVLITHKLDEVMEISDTITVMRARRDGRPHARRRDATPPAIARMMVGRDVVARGSTESELGGRPTPTRLRPSHEPPIRDVTAALTVQDLVVAGARRATRWTACRFDIAPGEILGIAGVEGNGQTELVEAIAGLRAVSSGSDHARRRATSRALERARARRRRPVAHPRGPASPRAGPRLLDRRQPHPRPAAPLHAARRARSARDRGARAPSRSRRSTSGRRRDAAGAARCPAATSRRSSSRARWAREFSVLLAAQPTRGVDVGAIEFIHAAAARRARSGQGVLLVSADLAEVLALADRIAVMYGGRFVCDCPAREATTEMLGPYMTGREGARASTHEPRRPTRARWRTTLARAARRAAHRARRRRPPDPHRSASRRATCTGCCSRARGATRTASARCCTRPRRSCSPGSRSRWPARRPVQHRRRRPARRGRIRRGAGRAAAAGRHCRRCSRCRSASLAAAVGGGVVGAVPGVLKARFGAHEVIVTIMLNFIVLALLNWIVADEAARRRDRCTRRRSTRGAVPRLSDVAPAFHGSAANATILLAVVAAAARRLVPVPHARRLRAARGRPAARRRGIRRRAASARVWFRAHGARRRARRARRHQLRARLQALLRGRLRAPAPASSASRSRSSAATIRSACCSRRCCSRRSRRAGSRSTRSCRSRWSTCCRRS